MNKIYKFALVAFLSQSAFGQNVIPTNYKGAFAPAPTVQWTDKWTNWDPQNTNYNPTNKTLVDVSTSITSNTTWTADKIYVLKGQIYVKNGAVLTIEPGTVIFGDKASLGCGLFITKGSQLIAEGTVDKPIVFTSNQDAGSRTGGDWGGVILLGKAKNNIVGGTGNIEGIAISADTEFGGNDDADNSGTLKYVRIEFAGYPYAPNKEINGLTFGSVGSGTTIDNVQVSFSNDDSFEWFGGSVNCKHLIAYRGLDDDFDTDNGYSGTVQFGLGVRDPKIADNPSVSTSEGFESDNDAAGSTNSPQTSATFTNMTMVGPLRGDKNTTVAAGYRRAARIRRNSALKIENSIMIDYKTGLHIDGPLSETNATNGDLIFKDNLLAGYLSVSEVNSGSTFNIKKFLGDNNNDTVTKSDKILANPYNYTSPDFRPNFTSAVSYRGAFANYPVQQWTDKWTNWDPQNTNYNPTNKTLVDVSTSITSNTTWTADKIYVLKGQIYVKNGAVLTIEPGTVIFGDKASLGCGLFITKGSQLIAEGTVDKPIVFTSNQDAGSRTGGDWGGVILLGKAKNNIVGGTGNIEGIAISADTEFGGNDDADNSGTLKYVRIEFAGYPYAPNKEINGLTFGSVGSGTTIDNVQVSFSNDDSFEWFGGSVNCKHLIAYRGLDDDFDTDNGYSGTVQFGLGVRDPKIADNPSVSTSEGFESDNDAAGSTNSPQTSATFTNMTMVGPLRGDKNTTVAAGYRRAARIRRNSALKIENSIMIDYKTGLHIDGPLCETNATNGDLIFKDNLLAGTILLGEVNAGSTFDIQNYIGNRNDVLSVSDKVLRSPYGVDFQNPDFRIAEYKADVNTLISEYSKLNLYPNPTSENVNLSIDVIKGGSISIEVYSITGVKLIEVVNGQIEIGTHNFKINTIDLDHGTYIVATTINGQRNSQKLSVIK